MNQFVTHEMLTVSSSAKELKVTRKPITGRTVSTYIRVDGAGSLYVGDADVSASGASKGETLAQGASKTIEGNASLYGLAVGADTTVFVMHVSER